MQGLFTRKQKIVCGVVNDVLYFSKQRIVGQDMTCNPYAAVI